MDGPPPDASEAARAHEYAAHAGPATQQARRHSASEAATNTAAAGALPARDKPATSIAGRSKNAPGGHREGEGVGDGVGNNAERGVPRNVTAATSPPAPSQDPSADASTPECIWWFGMSCVTFDSRKHGAAPVPTSCSSTALKA